MIRRFDIVDGRSRKARPCATLTYDTETGEYAIRIAEGVSPDEVPMMMEPFVERGQRDMGPEWSRRWVEERVVPPSRQNLGEILRAHDLEDYDSCTLLEAARGVSSQDYFIVRLPQEELEESRSRLRSQTGAALAHARTQAGLRQHELAQRAGVDQAVVSRVETGKANLTLETLHDLAYELGLEVKISLVKR